ncbi:hypothetical protein BIV57_16655 [Mangrovactinospora gilvigrisea]|uniref:Uncharacterized protein n=1 Tax=Mangrovactinospora gilvigrisea TaxID=1428644 RepID=A0A1J7C456_9ACTN|nr:hypothetical protein [Mangrovactinospora gilvigrisea]OIV36356.1 hypothetical protein BIV57_16655 [Mangrovactinospora gilvigrisea]
MSQYQQQPGTPPEEPPVYAQAQSGTGTAAQRQMWETKGKRGIGFGAVWAVAGLLITLITLSNAQGGGVYIVAWGPMLYGVYRIVSGAMLLKKARG